MAEIARLKGTVSLDDSNFQAGLRRASNAAVAFASKLGGVLKSTAFAGITAGAVTASIAIAGLGEAIKNGLDQGGKFNDLSHRIQDTAGNAAILSKAFDLAGIGGDALGTVINKMQKSISGGSSTFADLGINLQSLNKLSSTEQFTEIGNAIAKIQDPTKRATAAMEIFGKSGGQLLQIFGDGGALELAKTSLGSMPKILNENVDALDDMGDHVDGLKSKWDAFSVGITAGLVPVLSPLLDKMISFDSAKFGKGLGDDLAKAFDGQSTASAIANLAGRFVKVMSAAALSLGDVIGASLTAAFADPIATLQAQIESFVYVLAHPTEYTAPDKIDSVKKQKAQVDSSIADAEKEIKSKGPKAKLSQMLLSGSGGLYAKRAELQDQLDSFANIDVDSIKKRILGEGVRTGISGGGLTSEERIQKAMERIYSASSVNFPRTTSAVMASLNSPIDDSKLTNAINKRSFLSKAQLAFGLPSPISLQQALNSKPQDSLYSNMIQRAMGNRAQGYNGGSIGITGDQGSILRAPSRIVGGVRRRGESKEDFQARIKGEKSKDNKSVENNIAKTASSVEQIASILGGGS